MKVNRKNWYYKCEIKEKRFRRIYITKFYGTFFAWKTISIVFSTRGEKHLYEKDINSILLSAINSRSNLKKVKLFLLSRVPPEILIVILLKMG